MCFLLSTSAEEGGSPLRFSLISWGLPTGVAVVLMPQKDTTTYSHSQAVRSTSSLLSVDHDISCSSCSVVRCAKLTNRNKKLLGSYRSILYQQHRDRRATNLPCPLTERQREVTCDRPITQILVHEFQNSHLYQLHQWQALHFC